MNINYTNLTSSYNWMSQLFGVKKNQRNGLLNLTDVINAKNQKIPSISNKTDKTDK